MLYLNDVTKKKKITGTRPTVPHTCCGAKAAKELRRDVLLPPALILLMITEGQAARDPCPNIRQIKTTPITGMFAGRINLE